jgi:hypothetical protein
MGVCLYFTSVGPVAPEVETAIRAELQRCRSDQPWVLCEPPHFYPTDQDGRLRGGSKLTLHPWPDEWAEAAQNRGERTDLEELLRRLCVWSGRYELSWELEIEGELLGRIERGNCPPDVELALAALGDVGEFLAEEFPQGPLGDGDEGPPGDGWPRLWREPE